MTDHELIIAAAKVAGIEVYRDEGLYWIKEPVENIFWNPLYSDADAFRLMVDQTLILTPQGPHISVDWFGRGCGAIEEPFGVDKCAATRRAIVRAVIEKAKYGTKTNNSTRSS